MRFWRSPDRPPQATYQILTRPGCHLCEVMERALSAEFEVHGLTWSQMNIQEEPALLKRFGDSLPVLLRDGKAVAKGSLKPGQLQRIIFRKR